MIRKAFAMWVNPDSHTEYKRRHDEIWPDLAATLKAHGAHDYGIWLDADTSMLFASVSIESEERWKAVASTEVCQRWWAYMADIMPSNPDNSPKSRELREMFFLA